MATEHTQEQFNFRAYAWRQFKKNKPAYISLYVLLGLAALALIAPLLANEQPLYAVYKGHTMFPAISVFSSSTVVDPETGKEEKLQYDIVDWKRLNLESVVWAPITYSPGKSDLLNANYKAPSGPQKFKSPSGQIVELPTRFWHWLGTSKRGEDVLAGLLHGTRISLTIGILSMGIASFLGLILGALAGYFGDDRLHTTRGKYWTIIFGLFIAYYYAFLMRSNTLADAFASSGFDVILQFILSFIIFALVMVLFYWLGGLVGRLPWLNTQVSIPVDSAISRTIEILISLPRLVLIIAVAAIAQPSIINLMVIIGATSWTRIARFIRAEFLRIRNLEYMQAGIAFGFSDLRLIFRHALPNGIAPALVAIAFGIASAILIESALSFLGVGVPADVVTWGAMLNAGRANFSAWWLVIFPGFAIFVTVTIYNLLGEALRDALDPKLKQ